MDETKNKDLYNLDFWERSQGGWKQDSWIEKNNNNFEPGEWRRQQKRGEGEERDDCLKPTLKDNLMKQVKQCFPLSSVLCTT